MRALALAVVLPVLAACSSDRPVNLVVTVQRYDAASSCWANLTPDTPPAAALQLFDGCAAAPGATPLSGGRDQVRLVVDLGEAEFQAGVEIPPPTVKLIADGVELSAPVVTFGPALRRGHRAFFVGTFFAPAREVHELAVWVRMAAGFETFASRTFQVSAPTLTLSIEQCASGAACALRGQVGSVAVDLSFPGVPPQAATLTWTIDDVLHPAAVPVTLDVPGDGVARATAFVTVPGAREGAVWRLKGRVGTTEALGPPITLRAPAIEARLTCATPCAVAGGKVGLVVSAPLETNVAQASVSTAVNGSPGLSGSALNLLTADATAGTLSGAMELPVPAAPGATWTIDVTVGVYRAQTLATIVTSP